MPALAIALNLLAIVIFQSRLYFEVITHWRTFSGARIASTPPLVHAYRLMREVGATLALGRSKRSL